MIKINNLNKYYHKKKPNEIHVINNTNLEIKSPGLVTFLGSSGAGKSTLLHVIGGLDNASGDIIYDDVNLNKVSENIKDSYRNKHIGYIFQNYNLLPNLTVYENLKVQLELINVYDKEVIDRKITECLKIVGLEKYKKRKVTALSGGQQQRVSIARALVKGAEVIIADEPTGNLDTKNSIEIINILKVLSKKYLIILVTHNMNLAMHYSDRIIKIKDGVVIDDIINTNNNSLLHVDSNALYLKNYQKNEFNVGSNQVELYTKDGEKINLKLIVEQDAIYIENNNNVPIRVLNENTDRYIINDDIKEEFIDENTVLDLEYVQPQKRRFKDIVKNIISDFKLSLKKLFQGTIKSKLLYIAFFFIGIILCFCLNSLSISTTLSNNLLDETPKNAVKVDLTSATNASKYGLSLTTNNLIEIIETNDKINGTVVALENCYVNFKVIANRTTSINFDKKCFITTPLTYNGDETILDKNEIIISNHVADKIISYTKSYNISTYEELKGKEFFINLTGYYQGDMVIKDIMETNDYTFLVSDYIYFANSKSTYNYASYDLNYIWDTDYQYFSNYDKIKIPSGDSYVNNTSTPDVLISESLLEYFIVVDRFSSSQYHTVWKTLSDTFDVIGTVKDDDFNVIFKNKKDYEKFVELSIVAENSYLPYRSNDITILEGRLPENNYEIILPNTSFNQKNYPVGKIYTYFPGGIKLTVVGHFELKFPTNLSQVYTNYETALLLKTVKNAESIIGKNPKELYFYTDDIEGLSNDFIAMGYHSGEATSLVLEETLLAKIDASKIAILISVTIIVVMVLFIFFINRSKMMQNIYELGVLRALGAKKGSLYKQYVIDSIVVSTLTVVLGFTIMYIFTKNANNFIPGIAVSVKWFLLSLVAIYLVMIAASLFPIYLLLKKSPIEIINKYDI